MLKLVKKTHPEIDVDALRNSLLPMQLNEEKVNQIFEDIGPSPKKYNSELVFTAVMLLLFSPRAILLSEKSEYGVAQIIQRKLDLKSHQQSSYRIKVARDLYEVDRVFKNQVDDLVKRSRG